MNPRMQVNLNAEEAVALEEACRVLRWEGSRSKVARLAIAAVCQEIVNVGAMPIPLAVSLRWESDEETAARLACLPQKNQE